MILSDMYVCRDDNLLYNTITYHFSYIKPINCLLTSSLTSFLFPEYKSQRRWPMFSCPVEETWAAKHRWKGDRYILQLKRGMIRSAKSVVVAINRQTDRQTDNQAYIHPCMHHLQHQPTVPLMPSGHWQWRRICTHQYTASGAAACWS